MMQTMTSYKFGDVVLVPFPFTNQAANKKRPAIVVSSNAYHRERPDLILMAATSRIRAQPSFGEMAITQWKQAGLLKHSVIKPIFTTVEKGLTTITPAAVRQIEVCSYLFQFQFVQCQGQTPQYLRVC